MKYYKSLDFIPIYNFFKADEDIRYLIKDIDYEELPVITEEENNELIEIFETLKIDQLEDNSNKINVQEELRKSMARLINKHTIIDGLLHIIQWRYVYEQKEKLTEDEYYDFDNIDRKLKDYGYGLNYSNWGELVKEIEAKRNKLKGIENRINDKKIEFENENKGDKASLYDIIAIIEDNLGVKVDEFKDSMSKYLGYIKRLNTKINQQNANTRKAGN